MIKSKIERTKNKIYKSHWASMYLTLINYALTNYKLKSRPQKLLGMSFLAGVNQSYYRTKVTLTSPVAPAAIVLSQN